MDFFTNVLISLNTKETLSPILELSLLNISCFISCLPKPPSYVPLDISPNINRGAGGGDAEIKKTNRLLERILAKEGNVQIDGTNAGTAFAMTGYRIQ